MIGAARSARTVINRKVMTSSFRQSQNGSANANANGAFPRQHHTTTALGRWSIVNRPLPPVDQIKHLHVYDFDNTRELLRANLS